jgi:broad specificity phosphatase PhoE
MSRQLWLLRHGATEWALNGRHTGSTDLPLLPEGEEEARALCPVLSQQTFAAVFSSPLQRAQRTCELAGLGDRMQICDDIIEWTYGDYEGSQPPRSVKPSRTGRSGAMAAQMERVLDRLRSAAQQRSAQRWPSQGKAMLPCLPMATSSGHWLEHGWDWVPPADNC